MGNPTDTDVFLAWMKAGEPGTEHNPDHRASQFKHWLTEHDQKVMATLIRREKVRSWLPWGRR
ncbi:MAG: hypothetical protein FWF90_11325 [Promicromonosporaceae bacterium]|nr:hypothetical protein [Promicromonosporaceae bacterium]